MSRRFIRRCPLPVSASDAYAWHVRPGAFSRLKPPWQRLELDQSAAIENGSQAIFRMYKGPVPIRWVAEHRDVVPGKEFSDVQVEGPFKSWHHRHRFEPGADGTSELIDDIRFELPAGALGEAVAAGAIEADLERVFSYRHRLLADDLARSMHDVAPKTIAIAGASGMVGTALSAFLTCAGHEVRHLVRRAPENDQEIEWQPQHGVVRPSDIEGLDGIVYFAGVSLAGGRWTDERKQQIRDSRVPAVARLVEQLAELSRPPKVFLCASGIGYYGERGDDPATESAPAGEGFLAELARDWEAAAAGARDHGVRVVQTRFGMILSPSEGALAKMLPAFKAAAGGPLGSGRQKVSWIGLDDVVYACHHLLLHSQVDAPVNLAAPEVIAQKEFASVLGDVLRRPTIIPAPKFALRLALGEMADELLLTSTPSIPERLLESGYRFAYPKLEDALRHLLGKTTAAPGRVAAPANA